MYPADILSLLLLVQDGRIFCPWHFPEDGHNICILNPKSESMCGKKKAKRSPQLPAASRAARSYISWTTEMSLMVLLATNFTVISMGNTRIMLWKVRRAWFCVWKLICFMDRLVWIERNHLAGSVPVPTQGPAIRITNYDIKGHKISRATTNLKSITMMYGDEVWSQSSFLWRSVF